MEEKTMNRKTERIDNIISTLKKSLNSQIDNAVKEIQNILDSESYGSYDVHFFEPRSDYFANIEYSPYNNTLEILKFNGEVLLYKNVPHNLFEMILKINKNGDSIDDFFDTYIKGHFERLDKENDIELCEVNSSWINHFEYNFKTKILMVITIDGRKYSYCKVPRYTWEELKDEMENGASPGRFYNENIKGFFIKE